MEEADRLCNRVAIIDHGKIIRLDTPSNLKNSIGGDVISIETPEQEKLSTLLRSYKYSKSVKLHDGVVTINIVNAGKRIADIVRLAERSKIKIDSITIHKPSLEDVFLYYTGKTIREQEASAGDMFRERMRARSR